ncbi:MAG: sulfotransferase, partial [Asticcacaulis sp.]
RLLARILSDRDAMDEAMVVLESLLARAPDYHDARLDYGLLLLQQQKHALTRAQAEILLGQAPENRDYLKLYAAACVGLGDHEPVVDLYDNLLAGEVSSGTEAAELHLFRGNALKITGKQAEAIAAYRAALAARPDYGVAWFSLANLKTYRFSDEEVVRLQTAVNHPDCQPMDRVYLNFALGKAHEDRADYAASWACYERGNALRAATCHYDPEVADICASRLKEVFTPDFFAGRSGWGVADASPIFIVGLPRSGSTLIEQILASHTAVEGTQELTEIDRYAGEICGRDPACGLPLNPEAVARLTREEVQALGARFLSETRIYRRLGRPFFIDKMPNNVWHIGLIHLILPEAKIIDVRREPMACCFSNLKQLFGTTHQPFSYSVEAIARYYRTYLGLMRHWDAVLPQKVLRVSYEEVVHDPETSIRRLLSHCGLAFEPACLTFYDTQRSIRTPSSEQVRQPIGRDGLTQWQNYAPWLGGLRDILGDALIRYRS